VVNALAAFTLCKDDPEAQAEAFKKLTTFDMRGLDDVTEQYERELAQCTQRGKEARATVMSWTEPGHETRIPTSTLTALGRPKLASMLKDKAFASALAGVDAFLWTYHAMGITFILDVIRSLQLFVVEKRWGLVDEAFRVINYDLPVHAETPLVPPPPLTFREILNAPEYLLGLLDADENTSQQLSTNKASKRRESRDELPKEKLSKHNKNFSKNKAKAKPSDHARFNRKGKDRVEEPEEQSHLTTPLDELFAIANARHDRTMIALTRYQQNLKEGIAMIQAHNATIKTSTPKPPPLPASLKYNNTTILSNQPGLSGALYQNLFDLQFIQTYIRNSIPKISTLQHRVCQTINYWSHAGIECWEYVKRHCYEIPRLREYEYFRTDLAACYVLLGNLQRVVGEWVLRNGDEVWMGDVVRALSDDKGGMGKEGEGDEGAQGADGGEDFVSVDQLMCASERLMGYDAAGLSRREHWSRYLL